MLSGSPKSLGLQQFRLKTQIMNPKSQYRRRGIRFDRLVVLLLCASVVSRIYGADQGAVTVSAEFPGGNISVDKNEAGSVHVAPDLRGDRPWFYWYFEAKAVEPGRVSFVFPEKVVGFKNGAISFQGPAFSPDTGTTWRYLGTNNVLGKDFFYDFTKPNETVRFAVAIPYVQSDLDKFLIRNASNPHLKQSVLTKSRKGRPVELLQIGRPAPERKNVLVTGRHHAAETIASHVLEGFLQAAIADNPTGEAFRSKYFLYAVPFVDKDGVEDGDQGKNRLPHDHNRDYGPIPIYPEVKAIMELAMSAKIVMSLDFHCPTLVMPDHQVMYFVGPKDRPIGNFANVSMLAKGIKQGLPANSPHGPLVWLKPAPIQLPMNSYYFGFRDDAMMAATLEIPFAPPGKIMTPARCREYGKVVLEAWTRASFVSGSNEKTTE